MKNKMKNSELDKVSGGDRIEQAEDGKWMIYPYRKRFSTEKEAEEYVNSIINARAQKNYELEKKLLDDLHIEEITSELDKISGGSGLARQTADGRWTLYRYVKRFATEEEALDYAHSIAQAYKEGNNKLGDRLWDELKIERNYYLNPTESPVEKK